VTSGCHNTNKIISLSDLDVVEIYIYKINSVDSNDVQSAHLPQFKSYLKILDILYFIEDTNMPIDSSVIETIIKSTHIFNNIYIASKPHVIKISLKSDITIV